MLFSVYDEDGHITQANKVYDPEGYDKLLDDRGLKYLKTQAETLYKPDAYYVNVSARELVERPDMPIQITKTRIKAGSDDSTLITGIPADAVVIVSAAGATLHRLDPIDATELEISIPVPCVYSVRVDRWPYKPFLQAIEGI